MNEGTAVAGPSVDGGKDLEAAISSLRQRLPQPLAPLAEIAYNYRWSWSPGGDELFAAVDRRRWELCNHNPVRLLHEASNATLQRAAEDAGIQREAISLADSINSDLQRSQFPCRADSLHPIAFLCAEFAIHRSLPIYAGGLGVLAGDILKEGSDLALPMVGVGLLYREGYFIQRIDASGYQHEHWQALEPERSPAVLVRNQNDEPVYVDVPVRGRNVVIQIWRVNVGRVPLYLLDADVPQNSRVDRWITGRLYVGDRTTRLAQYALLGIGSIRALEAMQLDPAIVHLNEGHAALAPLELARIAMASGTEKHAAFAAARERTVFTTHTPVAAGNEGYDVGEVADVVNGYPDSVGLDLDGFLALGRTRPDNPHEPFVMTPLGIKMSRFANGVSRRHGDVARQMWQPLFPERPVETVPIDHITNGVHLPTWLAPEMWRLFDQYLGPDWCRQAAEEKTWSGIDAIPDAEIWQVRNSVRARFVEFVRDQTVANRLERGESREFVEAAERGFHSQTLTLGFARRLATYKRLNLLTNDPQRFSQLLEDEDRPVQLVLAGKAHPHDEEGKHSPQGVFGLRDGTHAPQRVSFLDNYDLSIASQMVAGCDLWINLPRPPLEASGTSGMKAAINGALNLSVLDGWWAEAFEQNNGWAISGDVVFDYAVQDARDAAAFYDLLQHEIIPMFYQRDTDGIPHLWVQHIKASIKSIAPRFCASRMVMDYVRQGYALLRASDSD